MNAILARIRWRLVAWTMLVLGLILAGLGTAVHATQERSLIAGVDRNLAGLAAQGEAGFAALARGERHEEREGYRGGVFYLLVGADGQVLANPQRVDTSGLRLPQVEARRGGYSSGVASGEPVRLYARPVGERGRAGATLVVGQSLAAEREALRSLLRILVAGGGAGLLLSLAGAWFLAGRALVPIQRAFERQQEFVADAAHELRTPLTVLRSATDLLDQHRREPLAANGELFDDVSHEIARMQRLAGDLLTLAHSDRGDLELAVAPVDLGRLAGDVARRTEPLAHDRGVVLTYRAPVEALAEVDPDRIEQVLLILLDNALAHTPAGGRVDVTVSRHDSGAVLEIADTGTGIAPEHLPRVFDRFYRTDTSRSRARGGTGLGLSIARALVEAHKGNLALTSAPGAGTRALVRLPLLRPAAPLSRGVSDLAPRTGASGT
jgi:signal transduction histidine kinase